MRESLNMGQGEFAAAINRAGEAAGDELRCDVRLVAKWEAGDVQWPQGRYRRALEAVTGMPCTALGFRPHPPRSTRRRTVSPRPVGAPTVDSTRDLEDPVQRREFLAGALAMAAPTPLSPGDGKKAVNAYVEDAERTLAQLQGLMRKFGAGQLVVLAEAQLKELTGQLEVGVDTPGLQSAAAWSYVLAGVMQFDIGNQSRARYLYKEALFLAQLAGDHAIVACAANSMSQQSARLGRLHEAVRLARLGAEHTPRTGRVASLLAVREAQAWALLGAEREANAAMRRAMDAYERAGTDPDWAMFFNESELVGAAGRVAADLGDWAQAQNSVCYAAADPSLPLRSHVLWNLLLAEVMVRSGDVQGAADVVAAVLPTLGCLSSHRVTHRVRMLATLPVGESSAARVWREQLEAHARGSSPKKN
ncbi:hypothetical protein TR74_21640 [Carbonactinospora thermoautotrophica]|uniref:Transcriptional regulator n=1 Tax=Carbonactinospora thermoautotrophica TaxID=1469144 RepID=A0A132N8V8_9ACTN|nr:hypothetical protein [Carbonactinospora thermoautotrophica]KWX06559.1 hypothetical protein TR74_21640 [Carbonactinospora thermoautotrophica]